MESRVRRQIKGDAMISFNDEHPFEDETTETRYVMSAKASWSRGNWEPCASKTEDEAKNEAIRKFRTGWVGSVLSVGVVLNGGECVPIASRIIGTRKGWTPHA
jgi:hypothetical protein